MISILPFFISAFAAVAHANPSQLAVENCRLEDVYAFSVTDCQIALTNNGSKPIRVFNIKTENEGDRIEPDSVTIAPHARVYLHAKMNAANSLADTEHLFRFHTDEEGYENRAGSAGAFVESALDQAGTELDFGVVSLPGELSQKKIELSSHEIADFRITRVLDKPAWLDASIDANGRTLVATIKPDAGWGLHVDFVKLAINVPQQQQAWILVKADIHGEVVPASNPLDMGLMRIGNRNEFKIPLTSRSGKPFKIGKILLDGIQGKAQLSPCEPVRDDCQLLAFTASSRQSGAVQGHIWIEFPEYKQRLNLMAWGLLVPRDFKVKSLDPDTASQGSAMQKDGASKAATTSSTDLNRAVKEAIKSTESAVPSGNGPLIKWSIANGLGIHGFQMFRADAEDGPFVLLNPTSIYSTAQTQDSVSYQWRDNTAESGKTYWYYIGIVYNDGHKQQLTGPQKVVAK